MCGAPIGLAAWRGSNPPDKLPLQYLADSTSAVMPHALNRKGQWYWDFVFVENSEGAHNSSLDNECLDKAEALIDEALVFFKE